MQVQRQYIFSTKTGQLIKGAEVDADFDTLVLGINTNDTAFTNHALKQADGTSGDTTKDKHVSNKQLKDILDALSAQNAKITINVTNIAAESERNNAQDTQLAALRSETNINTQEIAANATKIESEIAHNTQQDEAITVLINSTLQGSVPLALRDQADGKVYMFTLTNGALDTQPIGSITNNVVTIDYSALVSAATFASYQQSVTTQLAGKSAITHNHDTAYAPLTTTNNRLNALESGNGKIAITLQNGWTAASATPYARNDGDGYITIGGMMSVGTLTDDTTIFTLPSGYRPPTSAGFAVGCNISPYTALVYIGNDGVAKIRGVQGSGITNVRLDGVRFNTFAN